MFNDKKVLYLTEFWVWVFSFELDIELFEQNAVYT